MEQILNLIVLGPNVAQAITQFFSRLPPALAVSGIVTAGATGVALVLGMALALMRLSGVRWLSIPAAAGVYIGRCLPLPPMQFLLYFTMLALWGTEPIYAGILAIGVLHAAPMAELFRSGLASVPVIQTEAARALGMSATLIRNRVTMPIAIRLMLPAIGQMVIGMLLGSSYISQIGVRDITGVARNVINDLFSTELWFVVAFVYFAIAFPMSRFLTWLERRLAIQN